MEQADAATMALERTVEPGEFMLMRALETAIAVCYARAFTKSTLLRLSLAEYEPSEPQLAQLHKDLYDLRDEVYAHTDKSGGREASLIVASATDSKLPATVNFLRNEQWPAIERAALPEIRRLCALQRDRFHGEAGRIEIFLRGPKGLRELGTE